MKWEIDWPFTKAFLLGWLTAVLLGVGIILVYPVLARYSSIAIDSTWVDPVDYSAEIQTEIDRVNKEMASGAEEVP